VAPVRTNILEEHITSIMRVTRIRELRTTIAVTSNQSMLRRNIAFFKSYIALTG
jgi:hypothetical protein